MVEEASLGEFLPLLAQVETPEGAALAHVPSAVIALPADDATAPFSTAPVRPLREYYAAQPPAWNPAGLDLLGLTFPCAVFLALPEQAYELRAKAQLNVAQVRTACARALSSGRPVAAGTDARGVRRARRAWRSACCTARTWRWSRAWTRRRRR